MNYRQSVEAERIRRQTRRALTAIGWLLAFIAVCAAISTYCVAALWMRDIPVFPKPSVNGISIDLSAMRQPPRATQGRTKSLCFEASREFAQSMSDFCKDADSCAPVDWIETNPRQGQSARTLADVLADARWHVVSVLAFGGHDSTRIRPGGLLDSNFDLAMQRANAVVNQLRDPKFRFDGATILPVAVSERPSICPIQTNPLDKKAWSKERRTPVLLLSLVEKNPEEMQ